MIVPAGMTRSFLASLPVGLLRERLPDEWERADVPEKLERLGVESLGQLAALPEGALADRFGEAGLRALRMARGDDEPLRPRSPHEELVQRLELPEAASGGHCRCSSIGCSRPPLGGGGAYGGCGCPCGLPGAAAGARWSGFAGPASTPSACAWRFSRSWRGFPARLPR